jgi:hypothetical protein
MQEKAFISVHVSLSEERFLDLSQILKGSNWPRAGGVAQGEEVSFASYNLLWDHSNLKELGHQPRYIEHLNLRLMRGFS